MLKFLTIFCHKTNLFQSSHTFPMHKPELPGLCGGPVVFVARSALVNFTQGEKNLSFQITDGSGRTLILKCYFIHPLTTAFSKRRITVCLLGFKDLLCVTLKSRTHCVLRKSRTHVRHTRDHTRDHTRLLPGYKMAQTLARLLGFLRL